MRFPNYKIRAGCLVPAAFLPTAAQTVTPWPETGVTPGTLLLYRAELIPGKEAAYAQTEAEIVRSRRRGRI